MIDEVGWGALAGPLVSVVVVFDERVISSLSSDITDSKRTTEKRREMLYLYLCKIAVDVGIGHAFPWEIDTIGPWRALQLSYTRALGDLKHKPDLLYVDGKECTNKVVSWNGKQICEPRAELKYKPVAAASIIAKVFRDRLMVQEGQRFPEYNWVSNKGYGSKDHQDAIRLHGLIINEGRKDFYFHRKSYCGRFMFGTDTKYHQGADLEE